MLDRDEKLKVGIIGSGNIGTDLLVKIRRSPYLECTAFVGRKLTSQGMMKASDLGVNISADGINYFTKNPNCCDLVFDATNATSHIEHFKILDRLNIKVIDLTPAQIGKMCVPSVNMADSLSESNVNMVTCGGQASIPVAFSIGKTQKTVNYVEVISSIASKSAGPATRINLDEYIQTTEKGIKEFSGAAKTKAILILNPAEPSIDMQTTIFAKVDEPNIVRLKDYLSNVVKKVQEYVPGYEVILGPIIENERIVVMIRVRGLGDYLPAYAGNLDIINCAAIAAAEEYALKQINLGSGVVDGTR